MMATMNGRATKQAGLPGLEGFGAALGALTATVDRACDAIDRVLVQPFSDAVDRLNARVEAAKDKVQKLLERASGLASDAQAAVLGMSDALAASVATACEEAGCDPLPAIEMDEAAWAGMVGENAEAQPLGVPLWATREELIAAYDEREKAKRAIQAALAAEVERLAEQARTAALAVEAEAEAEQAARDELNAVRTDGQGDALAEAAALPGMDPKGIAEDACRRHGVNHVAAGAVPDAEAREASAAPKPPRKSRKGGK